MTLIEHYEAPSAVSSITFSDIPDTFTDLYLVFSLRLSGDDDYFTLNFNGSGTGFTSRTLRGNGSTATSTNRSDGILIYTANRSSYTANTFSNGQIYIPNYLESVAKSFSVDSLNENNATAAGAQITAGLWNNTAAISSITLNAVPAMNFVQYSSASLFGVLAGSDGIVSVS
jgi:hypothetical protein